MTVQQPRHVDSTDELLRILADDRRRAILEYLRDSSTGAATVEMLADKIDEEDHGGDEANAAVLVHADLPKLDDGGLVDFDRRSMTVRYRSHETVEQLLDCVEAL
jgi:DNA-binding transcriptional ArsR family regulator